MADLSELVDRLEVVLAELEELEGPTRDLVFELLDGVDTIHRMALGRLATRLDAGELRRVSEAEPAVAWLLQAYGIVLEEPPARPVPVDLRPTRPR